ncbi:serine hydrolase [Streptomyces filamentosus]|uniref:D-alanyl-D-alanine carboxypeptidase family protein n=1 Tax=Streptomyces filamentosus TaxID=67294 RepID=UPI003F4CEA2B
MTHGGGTVAGESPDRAEQQGSSEGRTPGSSSTVASSDSPAPATAGPGRVDQPTAVFKTLAPRTPEDDAEPAKAKPVGSESDAASESESESDAALGSGSGSVESESASGTVGSADGSGAPEGDRLKDAVAAWVAKAAEGGDTEGSTEGSEDSRGSRGSESPEGGAAGEDRPGDASGAVEAAAEPVEAPAGVEEPAEAPEAPKASEAPSWFAAKKQAETPEPPKSDSAKSDAPKDAALKADSPESDAPRDAAPKADAPGPATTDSATNSTTDSTPAKPAAAKPAAEDPVDQPTTMFRAVRPPAAPAVDQPTTALKLPRDLEGPGSDSERTSTFVPLRPDLPTKSGSSTNRSDKADKADEADKAGGSASASASAAPTSPASPSAPAKASAAPAKAGAASPSAPAEAERTRQQPLPPLPPLDLLAELTNTPPPPPSAWRTTMRRIRIWTPLVLILLIVFAIAQVVRPLPAPVLKLSAEPTFTFGGGPLQMPWPNEGQGAVEVEGVGSMGTYGAQKPAPIASVTKTMTAYVILRDHPIKGKQQGPEITIDKKAAEQANATHESTAAVREGQTYTEKELLELLMIPSANNVARLLARWDAGSEQAFVDKMNAAAKDLGMTQSRYTDPSGLLDSTVSTPRDQLKLAKAVMQYDVFREIVNMPNVTVDGIPGRIENNNNILLKDGVSGIKTGSSTPAGGNLLWSANTLVDGQPRRILGIVMGAKNAKILNDKLQLSIDYSYELIKKAQEDVTSAAVVKKGQVVGYVDDGLGGRTPVVATKEIKAVGWPGLKVELALTDGGRAVPHSGRAGDVVGTIAVGEGAGKVSSPVALKEDLVEPGFDKKLTRVG